MVKFIRLRGRIIPIVQKAVAKGSGYFGRKSKMIAHEENIKAIRAIRKVRSGKGELIGSGQELFAYHAKGTGKVVKEIRDYVPDFRIERRFAVENALSKIGYSPKVHLVKTNKKSYIVQDKIKLTASEVYENIVDKFPHLRSGNAGKPIENAINKAIAKAKSKFDIEGIDDHWGNWGFTGKSNKAKLIDGGYASFDGANNKHFPIKNRGTAVLWRFHENRAKLMARSKKIQIPNENNIAKKRKIIEELRKNDKFNLLGRK